MKERLFFHIDMDAFFASVEQVDNPSLAGKPVIVGASPGYRGVVSTCSYEARKFGIHSAMPINTAYALCPKGIFLPVRMKRYMELSNIIMEIFENFTPEVLRLSVDEASLDMTGTELLWGDPVETVKRIKAAIKESTGLTASIGIANNRYLAKIACGLQKPDGLTLVPLGKEEDFVASLPLAKLWGAGEKTQKRLSELGIMSVKQLKALPEKIICSLLGKSCGSFLFKAVRGFDPGFYTGEVKNRSLGSEITFEVDIDDRETIESTLLSISEQLSLRMFSENKQARTLQVKIRYSDFETLSVRQTRRGAFTCSAEIYASALDLFFKKWNGSLVRLIGLSLSSFSDDSGGQAELFATGREKAARVEQAAFNIQKKGLGKVTRARLIDAPRKITPEKPS